MQIGSLENTFTSYRYIKNRNYDAIKDRFTRNVHIAIDHLCKTNALTLTFEDQGETKKLDIIHVLVEDLAHNIRIIPGPKNAYSPSYNTVIFYDTHGAVFKKNHQEKWFRSNKGHNSPVALLSHELIHCYNKRYQTAEYTARKKDHSHRGEKIDLDGHDLSFPNAEEAFVIKMTNQVVKHLGEDKRSNYGRTYYPTESVLSTKPKRKG